MRDFSYIENKVIDRICEGHIHMSSLLIDHIPDLILDLNTDEQKVQLIIKKPKSDKDLIEIARSQTETIMYIIKFLIYLEQDGFLLTGYFAHGRSVESKWVKQKNFEDYNKNKEEYIHWGFTDKRMEQFIFKYADQSILPMPKLIAFKKRGYQTKEDKRHKEIVRITYIAIGVSLLFGIWGFYQNYDDNKPTMQQLNTIIKELQDQQYQQHLPTKQQVDSLIKEIKIEKSE